MRTAAPTPTNPVQNASLHARMVTFLGGVRDQAGRRGFVPLASRTVVAVDLVAGRELWRKERIGRPIAATDQLVVTCGREGADFKVRVFGAADGRDVATLDAPGIPAWAVESAAADGAFQVTVTADGNRLHLVWHVRQQYRGGAPPRPDIAAQARRQAAGAWQLNLDTLSLRATDAVDETAMERDAADAHAAPADVSSDASVVALARVGDCLFALTTVRRDSATVIMLEARGTAGGVLWQVDLGESGVGPPRALRK